MGVQMRDGWLLNEISDISTDIGTLKGSVEELRRANRALMVALAASWIVLALVSI